MARLGQMIERALAWEPMNSYCWSLWAEWFAVLGRSDAREWTLREMSRLFPDDEVSRVELARMLMRRGEVYWDEAEHWLRQASERNPDGKHSRVVLANLLMNRGKNRFAESEFLLRRVLDQEPNNEAALSSIERLDVRRGQFGNDENLLADLRMHHDDAWDFSHLDRLYGNAGDFVDEADDGSNEDYQVDDSQAAEPRPPLSAVMEELEHRGRLGEEFANARIAGATSQSGGSTELIRTESRNGDPLAGFYSQWLMPDETPKCPPHAWAWRACQYWQQSAQDRRWHELARQFPETARESEFLRIISKCKTEECKENSRASANRWRNGCGSDDHAVSPNVEFMRREIERYSEIDPDECDEVACTVMANKAAEVPEFTLESVDLAA